MKIAILGAGGVGGYYGGMLAAAGHDVRLLARGEHLDAIRVTGLRVRTPDGAHTLDDIAATDDPDALGDVDLAVVAVKSYSLEEIAPVAARLARGGEGGRVPSGADVLPLLNGVDAVPRLAAAGVPPERLLGGVTYISAMKIEPGVIERRSPFQRVIVGEPDGGLSNRADRTAAAFREAGADARASDDIGLDLWRKLVFLAALSSACAFARSPIGPVRERKYGRALLERLVREATAVARARGVALPDDEDERALELLYSVPAGMRPSFLLDLERGGPNELDVLSGAIARMGREARVETPVHDAAAATLV